MKCFLKVRQIKTVFFVWALMGFNNFWLFFVKNFQDKDSDCFYEMTYKL
jgi:hypothetical protein